MTVRILAPNMPYQVLPSTSLQRSEQTRISNAFLFLPSSSDDIHSLESPLLRDHGNRLVLRPGDGSPVSEDYNISVFYEYQVNYSAYNITLVFVLRS